MFKPCEICGKEFYVLPSKVNHHHCCSLACREIRKKQLGINNLAAFQVKTSIKKICTLCGKEFEVALSKASKIFTCSNECKGKSKTGKNHPNYNRITKNCPNCNKEFETPPSLNRLYCSDKCRRATQREKSGYAQATCVTCNKEFTYHTGSSRGIYCSQACQKGQHRASPRICVFCSKEFYSHNKQIYCSSECFQKHRDEKTAVYKICPQCKKEFRAKSGFTYITFCSKECELESHYETRMCLVCGSDYKEKKSIEAKTCKNCRRKLPPTINPEQRIEMNKKIAERTKIRMSDSDYAHEIQRKRLETLSNHSVSSKVGFRSDINEGKTFIRSTWEANILRILTFENIEWEYESKNCVFEIKDIDDKNKFMVLDIFLPKSGTYIEVKGWKDPARFYRYELLKKQHPHVELRIIDEDDYKNWILQYKDKIGSLLEGPSKDLRIAKPLDKCVVCGEFTYRRRQKVKYCSNECRRKEKGLGPKICAGCEKSFLPKKTTQKTCSRACRDYIFMTVHHISKQSQEMQMKGRLPVLTKVCSVCATSFETKRESQVVCSTYCRNIQMHRGYKVKMSKSKPL